MIEKKYFLNEINSMTKAILNGGIKTTEYNLIGQINQELKEDFNLPIRQLAERMAVNDLNKIKEALEVMYNYEKAGIKFNFINYKSKED